MPPFSDSAFGKKEQNYWYQVTEICQTLLMVYVAHGHGRIQGVGSSASSYQPFSNMFLMYTNFSIIFSLFDSTKPYAISTHN